LYGSTDPFYFLPIVQSDWADSGLYTLTPDAGNPSWLTHPSLDRAAAELSAPPAPITGEHYEKGAKSKKSGYRGKYRDQFAHRNFLGGQLLLVAARVTYGCFDLFDFFSMSV